MYVEIYEWVYVVEEGGEKVVIVGIMVFVVE